MKRHITSPTHRHPRQGGAVIIVVLSLMTSLLFLGLFFFNWTSMERASAEFHASANDSTNEIDPQPIFENFLRQTIIGPKPVSEQQSALYGGHYSLLASILGTPVPILDVDGNLTDEFQYRPFAHRGRGMTVIAEEQAPGIPSTHFRVDYGDGSFSSDQTDFILNFSLAANSGTRPPEADYFNANVGYTYPDANSMFLAFDEQVPIDLNLPNSETSSGAFTRVVIPSYFRPQLFTDLRLSGDFTDLYHVDSTQTANQVLRPHQLHEALIPGVATSGEDRFLRTMTPAMSGDRNRLIEPFPITNNLNNRAGIFTHPSNLADPIYGYDGDVDRDGVPDSILLDLGHPIMTLKEGRQVVPLAMIKWIDNDALLNVNAHGNQEGFRALGRDIQNDEPLSISNQGLSSFEVNLGLGLTADPTSTDYLQDMDQANRILSSYRGMHGNNPLSRAVGSNMDLFNLLNGRLLFDSSTNTTDPLNIMSPNALLGRYGDGNAILNYFNSGDPDTLPTPGEPGQDDDQDTMLSTLYASWGHPRDVLGVGGDTTDGPSGRIRRLNTNGESASYQYPAYNPNWTRSQLDTTPYSPGALTDLVDEADETLIEPALRSANDALFASQEIFGLQASSYDQYRSGTTSMLQELAPLNFRDNYLAPSIRKRFTTDSWDRLEYSHRPSPDTHSRHWEFNDWNFVDNGEYTNSGIIFTRAFPPRYRDANVFDPTDPYRPMIRRLLTSLEDYADDPIFWGDLQRAGATGQRINVNRFLEGINSIDGTANYIRLPRYEDNPLTARQYRQQMARDIYVLLYTIGFGDHFDPTTMTPTTEEDVRMVTMMAQFAVNVVDALDPDDVITVFKYDADLSNGWNLLNDDPLDDEGHTDQRFAYGVEAQQFTISEAMFVHAAPDYDNNTDDSKTEWNDEEDRSFAYIELQNVLPTPLTLDNKWQLQLSYEFILGGTDPADPSETVPPPESRELILGTTTRSYSVPAGGLFTIGTAGDDDNTDGAGVVLPSYMRLDLVGAGLQTIVPKSEALDLDLITADATDFALYDPASPGTPIDTTPANRGQFFTPLFAKAVSIAKDTPPTSGPPPKILLKLRRVMNLDQAPDETNNPWIEVDRVEIFVSDPMLEFGFVKLDMEQAGSNFEDYINNNLKSRVRPEPFDRNGEYQYEQLTAPNPGEPEIHNTLGEDNGTQFRNWQPHFDRDFTSLAELFSIPVVGPAEITRALTEKSTLGTPPAAPHAKMSGRYYTALNPETPATLTPNPLPSTAGVLFQNPQLPENTATPGVANNRWARVLEFFHVLPGTLERLVDRELPSTNAQIAKLRRAPGKINLNTLRHETNLAALIDDETIARMEDPGNGYSPTTNLIYDTTTDPAVRVWYNELLRSRDAADPLLYANGDTVHIPGTPGSVPFRSLSTLRLDTNDILGPGQVNDFAAAQSNRQSTIRPHGPTSPITNDLGLFEARSTDDLGNDEVDFHTRHRLLSKVMNNGTTRSHVYSGWFEIVFHEAHEVTVNISGTDYKYTQVGARAEDLPSYRMFCVVDLSRLEEAYDPRTNTFDYRKFLLHRQILP